ncbi:MAG: GNAT family N-acetyltransferase [Deltaproteobacteria bacterium]|nr:GNAT family N-acetyltransferase [Deltaproteobacteria bacterium]
MTHRWHIREYREGDEEQILRLRQQVFGDLDPVRLKPSTWRWQFRHNPAGEAFCALAEDQGRIVGQYAVIPSRFSVQGKETVFALSCDTMIHPDYRRQGLFTTLAQEVYRRIESERRITTVWGFPNEVSLPGFTRHLSWRLLTVFPLRVVPLRPIAILRHLLPLKKGTRKVPENMEEGAPVGVSGSVRDFPDIPGLMVEPITRFEKTFDALWNRNRRLAPVIQIRDAAYLNWRYLGAPDFHYRPFAIRFEERLIGYMVIRTMTLMGHFFGVLADLFPFPLRDPLTTQRLFRFARDECRTQGAEFMTCLLSRADPSFFKAVGLRTVPSILNPRKWHFGVRYAPHESDTLGDISNWHVTYGDTDIV